MEPLEDLVAAYRILAEHGVIDAYGHVSLRSPRDPNRYFIARSIAPERVQLEVETWYGLFAPAGTPMEVVNRLNREINSLLTVSQIKDLLSKQGMAAAGGTPERFGALVKQELARWTRVVDAAGIKAD